MPIEQTGTMAIGDGEAESLPWRLIGEALHLSIGGQNFTIESAGDLQSQVQTFFAGLARSRQQVITVRCCFNCRHLQMSGMARDMDRGQRGVCTRHRTMVEIMQSCDSHVRVSM